MISEELNLETKRSVELSDSARYGTGLPPPLVTASQVAIHFGLTEVVAPLDLEIGHQEFVALVGPSGCGKTSLLRLIAGLLAPSHGTLIWNSRFSASSAAEVPSIRRAFVFQDPTLLPWRTVLENVQLPLELQRCSRAKRREAAEDAIERVGLARGDLAKFPRMLSGGMRMRVSLARALVTRPNLLLLDEPFAPLDDLLRQRLNEELLTLWNREGWTGIFVTHNVAEAVYLSQRILVMQGGPGRIVAEIPVPFPYPRDHSLRATPEFARVTGEVAEQLRRGNS
jgi:NitT/TauT family transport system ATP-binding protein